MRNYMHSFPITVKLGVIILWSGFLSCNRPNAQAGQSAIGKDNPNVIIIYADDLGYGDVSCYYPPSKIHTPDIDALAKEGMMFTDAHSAASYCTPSRYSILTGNYCWRSELTSELQGGYGPPIIGEDEMTLGHLFRKNGYGAAAIGKWHVGMEWTFKEDQLEHAEEYGEESVDFEAGLKTTPIDRGFDYYFGTSGCTSDDSPFAFIENRKVLGLPLTPVYDLNVVGDGDYLKDVLVARDWAHEKADTIYTNRAIEFIEEQVTGDKPFFVYLALSLPHIPWLPPGFVKGTTDAGPRGDQVALIDYCVGEIVATLERLGVEENTMVIFTSDNGPRQGVNGHRSAGDLRGHKGSIYEGGHRVPFIVKWPGRVAANTESDQLMGQLDLMATLAGILEYPLDKDDAPDSYDFSNVLLGQDDQYPVRESYIHHNYAVRKGDWKLIFDIEDIESVSMNSIEAEELYNLKEDLSETDNVIDSHPELVKELMSVFVEAAKSGHTRPELQN